MAGFITKDLTPDIGEVNLILNGFYFPLPVANFKSKDIENNDKPDFQFENWPQAKTKQTSVFGTPIVDSFLFNDSEYTDFNNKKVKLKGIRINTAILTVTQTKNIVKTAIEGRPGTIKEFISMGDFEIDFKAIIMPSSFNDRGKYPEKEVSVMRELLNAPVAIPAVCDYLSRLGIFNIVVENYNFPQQTGMTTAQLVEAKFVSDSPPSIKLLTDF
jgi:hypothetical protein